MACDEIEDCMKQGQQYDIAFTWHDGEKVPTNYDVTGYTARFQLRESAASTVKLYETTEAADITLGAAEDWHVMLVIPTATTEAFTFKRALGDLELVDPSGEVVQSWRVVVDLTLEVTK